MNDFESIPDSLFDDTQNTNTKSGIALKTETVRRMNERMKHIDEAVEVHLETLKYETGQSFSESIDIS